MMSIKREGTRGRPRLLKDRERLVVYIDKEDKELLNQISREEMVPVGQIVRRMIRHLIRKHRPSVDDE